MERRNIVAIETQFGYRTLELFHGDVSRIEHPVDVIGFSAYAGDYAPLPGTVISALSSAYSLDVAKCRAEAAYDLTSALGVWISKPLTGCPFTRLLCVEISGTPIPVHESIENVFVGLSVLEAKGGSVGAIALPVLGAGSMNIDSREIVRPLLQAAKSFFHRSAGISRVLLVEQNSSRVDALDAAMDEVLGRARAFTPLSELLESLRKDIENKLLQHAGLFDDAHLSLRDEWLRALASGRTRSIELGILSRRLLELLVSRIEPSGSGPLFNRIDALQKSGVAPWIRGYMHVLRQLGNEAAHEASGQSNWRPQSPEPVDAGLCLSCVNRLLEFWLSHGKQLAGGTDRQEK